MNPLQPVARMSMKDIAMDRIRHLIDEKGLQAGDRFMNEKEMMAALGVSRTVVREAVKSLETVGVLKLKPGDGIYVTQATIGRLVDHVSFGWTKDVKRMKELLETRIMLEKAAIELAIARFDEHTVESLAVWNRKLADAIASGHSVVESDLGFHRSLFELSGNTTFQELSEVVTAFLRETRRTRLANKENSLTTLKEHEQITAAIACKDIEGAKAAMQRHLIVVADSLGSVAES